MKYKFTIEVDAESKEDAWAWIIDQASIDDISFEIMPDPPELGILIVETDFDFTLKLDNNSCEDEIYIDTIQQLKNLEFCGPWGTPLTANTKISPVREQLAKVIANPYEPFYGLGGNRGIEWKPRCQKENGTN